VRTRRRVWLGALALVISVPGAPAAETLNLTLLKKSSQASFRNEAPLETFVGTSALEGIDGILSVDPGKPQEARGSVKIDMNRVGTGVARRDADMRGKNWLNTEVEANRWVTFEVQRVEMAGPLASGKEAPARIHGLLTVKQKAVPRIADATVMYIRLTDEQATQQKNFGFTSDNIKVKAKLTTSYTEHGMQVPQLLFLALANEIHITADLLFVRAP
jgi:polyisoprenoid-binding protein YceI